MLFRAPLLDPRPKHEPRSPQRLPSCPVQGTRAPSRTPPLRAHGAAPWGGEAPAHLCHCLERAPLPPDEDAGSAALLLSEKTGPRQGTGFDWGASLPAPCAARSADRPSLPLRPAVLSAVRPDDPARLFSAQLGGGGVHSAAAPMLWPLRPQRAASGSARAGGGCYARNVRVSGSP